jgi:hypothetical protein
MRPPQAPPGPPRRRGGRLPAVLLAGAGIVVTVAVLGALLTPDGDGTAGGTSVPLPERDAVITEPPAPPSSISATGANRSKPVPIGTSVAPAKGWTVTVTGAQLDADATMREHSFLLRPSAGRRYVLVSMTVAFAGERAAATIFGEMNLLLLTPRGTTHGSGLNLAPNRLDPAKQVASGSSLSGNVVFEVPIGDIPGSVLLAEPAFTLDRETDKRYLRLS